MKPSDTKILSQIKQAVLAVDADAELILFGSRARGDYKEDSDWDVLVLTNNQVNLKYKNSITDKLFYVQLDNLIVVTPVIVNKSNWYNKFSGYPLFQEIEKDGAIL